MFMFFLELLGIAALCFAVWFARQCWIAIHEGSAEAYRMGVEIDRRAEASLRQSQFYDPETATFSLRPNEQPTIDLDQTDYRVRLRS